MVTLRRDILAVVHRFVTHRSTVISTRMGTGKMVAPPGSMTWETFRKASLLHPWWHQRKGQIKGLGGMEQNQSGMPSGLPLVHLHPASMVEPGGMSKMPLSVRDRLSPTREGKLWWKFCLHPHLEQGRMLPVEKKIHGCGCRFFLSYGWELAFPEPFLYNVF